jgi:hypothetical protein
MMALININKTRGAASYTANIMKPSIKDQLIQVLYENRVALFIIAMLILAAIIGHIQQPTPEMR